MPNIGFFVSLVTLVLIITAVYSGGRWINDRTPNADRQMPTLALLPPGSDAKVYFNGSKYEMYPSKGFTEIKMFFPLGTDMLGRDLLSRIIRGGQISLTVGFISVGIGLFIGVWVGMMAGFYGGLTDKILSGLMTVIWSIPSVLLALILSFVMGKGIAELCLVIGLSVWTDIARIIRSQTMVITSSEYVTAGKALGKNNIQLLFGYILPGLKEIVLILACANFGTAILLESGLSFLGMGLSPPVPGWGNLLQEGYPYLVLNDGKWQVLFPSIILVILIGSVNYLNVGLKSKLSANDY